MNLDFHDAHWTIGSAWGTKSCRIPSTGHDWIPTVPPIAESLYRHLAETSSPIAKDTSWSTVTHWYGTSDVQWESLWLRGKRASFQRLMGLPGLTEREFAVASDLVPEWEDYLPFKSRGWHFRPVKDVCQTMSAYFDFISRSTGEIGVAKEGYVTLGTGWLSDRSMTYLALGKPVVALDTGWSRVIGESEGLRAFDNVEEAADAILDVEENYEEACRSARHTVSTVFGAPKVIGGLLVSAGLDTSLLEV